MLYLMQQYKAERRDVNNNVQGEHGSADDVPSSVEAAADRFDILDISTIPSAASHQMTASAAAALILILLVTVLWMLLALSVKAFSVSTPSDWNSLSYNR